MEKEFLAMYLSTSTSSISNYSSQCDYLNKEVTPNPMCGEQIIPVPETRRSGRIGRALASCVRDLVPGRVKP